MSDQQEEMNMGSTVWQSQPVEAPRISLEFVHHHAGRLRRSLRNEWNMFYILATLVVTSALALFYKQWVANDWSAINAVVDISMLLSGLGLVVVAFNLRRNFFMKQIKQDADIMAGLTLYRSELERLIQLAHKEWHVMVYFIPGYLTLLVGGLMFDQRPGKTMRYGLTIAAGILGTCFAFWAGRKRSRCLQRDLDAINSMK